MRSKSLRLAASTAAAVIAMGTLAACGSDEGGSAEDPAAGGGNGVAKDTEINIAGIAGWWEGIAVGNLMKHVLEERGYTDVSMNVLQAGPTFQGVADDNLDLFFDTWLPTTHEDYWKKYEEDVVDVGVWYEKAPLTITVPSYMDIDSIEDLPSIGEKVDWTITGIDSGAGLYRLTKNEVIPQYGLKKYEMPPSSGTAMTAALSDAIDNKEPIVVTLWHPHWAYGRWDLKDLEDPKNALGDPDSVHVISSNDLAESNPEIIDTLSDWTMSDEKLSSLGDLLQQDEYKNDIPAGVAAWAEKNPDVVESLAEELPSS